MNDKKQAVKRKGDAILAFAFVAVPFICILDGFGTLFAEVIAWLKTGYWRGLTFWSGLEKWFLNTRPSLGWVVPNQVLSWVLDGPRWLWMPILGLAVIGLEIAVISVVTDWSKRVFDRWRARGTRPLVSISKRLAIGLMVTVAWLILFPVAATSYFADQRAWDDFLVIALGIAFWGWIIASFAIPKRPPNSEGKLPGST